MAARRPASRVANTRSASRPAKKTTKRRSSPAPIVVDDLASKSTPLPLSGLLNKSIDWRFAVLGAVVLGLLALGVWKKHWVIAAMVNGKPVTGLEVLDRMSDEYRKITVDNIVNEKIILDAAKERNSMPTEQEMDQRIADIEAQYGGKDSLDNILSVQGQTRDGLRRQLKLQVAMEKMFASEATVSEEEIEAYLKDNKALLTATEPLAQRAEAEKNLRDEKLRAILADRFQKLKEDAKVTTF